MSRFAVLLALAAGLALPAAAPADPVARGAQVFADTCARCHGATGLDGASGDIRGIDATSLKSAVRGAGQMPEMPLAPEDIDAVRAWLALPLDALLALPETHAHAPRVD